MNFYALIFAVVLSVEENHYYLVEAGILEAMWHTHVGEGLWFQLYYTNSMINRVTDKIIKWVDPWRFPLRCSDSFRQGKELED